MRYPKDCPAFKTPWGILEGRPALASISSELRGHGLIEEKALMFTVGDDEWAHAINRENPRRVTPLTRAARCVLAIVGLNGTR